MSAPGARILIVGWDAATWDLAGPWIDEGHLPNLARIASSGARGPLRSTLPPVTFPAWSTFLTGVGPGSHGVFDFTFRRAGTYTVELANARARRAPTIWRILSDRGRQVGSVAVPVTYPPEPVLGAMISGFDAPGVGSKADASSMYPPELFEEIRTAVGEYLISAHVAPLMERGRSGEALQAILRTVDRKAATALYLLRKGGWDAFMVMFGETDLVGHHFWKFHDPSSPFNPARSGSGPAGRQEEREAILAVYRRLDEHLGALVDAAGERATVIVVSDHGFGAAGERVIRLNRWLADEGFLEFRGAATGSLLHAPLSLAKKLGLRYVPAPIRRILLRSGGIVNAMESQIRFGRIDLPRTQAFSEETPHFPSIWIHRRGRDPLGVVEPGAPYEDLRTRILSRLRALRDPESGRPVVERALRREEAYQGEHLEGAPDIVIDWALDENGRSYQNGTSRGAPGESAIAPLRPSDPEFRRYALNKSGSHRMEGICAFAGPSIRPGASLTGASIADVAPTILYLLGQPIPRHMEGRILEEALDPKLLDRFPPVLEEASRPTAPTPGTEDADSYSEEEAEEVRKRLQGLGYLE